MTASPIVSRRALTLWLGALFMLLVAPFTATADDHKSHDMPALPLSASFDKGEPGENGGPYALTVKNTSDHALTLEGMVIFSVTSHNRAQDHHIGPKTLAAGESWTINDLAVEDRVVLHAEGYAKWEKKTPPGKH
ncbi:hypothetical protein [Actomonas aquatica]|uniref:Copper resistance protein CopC n=1 Tax=Actomonas aquatica TaxID=2866162 RepID=A0ABZ1C2V3_9BACT|nr:hypothetical protein [Opitutus sp. WL0086]WRQ86037.1 hypothetical protein K1X11_014580 [Opitutus sp. WL0086]